MVTGGSGRLGRRRRERQIRVRAWWQCHRRAAGFLRRRVASETKAWSSGRPVTGAKERSACRRRSGETVGRDLADRDPRSAVGTPAAACRRECQPCPETVGSWLEAVRRVAADPRVQGWGGSVEAGGDRCWRASVAVGTASDGPSAPAAGSWPAWGVPSVQAMAEPLASPAGRRPRRRAPSTGGRHRRHGPPPASRLRRASQGSSMPPRFRPAPGWPRRSSANRQRSDTRSFQPLHAPSKIHFHESRSNQHPSGNGTFTTTPWQTDSRFDQRRESNFINAPRRPAAAACGRS